MNLGAQWIVTGATDRGRTRTRNEDSFAVVPEHGIAIVADGMGGHPGGDVASRIAVRALAASLVRGVTAWGPDDASDVTKPHREQAMRLSVLEAHNAIRDRSRAQPALAGMGTTATAVVFDPDGDGITLGHVGDSRCYRLRGAKLTQLTRDDTVLQQRMEAGQVRWEDARGHPHGHMLTQCLGLATPPEPSVLNDVLEPGDALLLCSDGLTACLSDEEVEAVLGRSLDATKEGAECAVADLIREANAAGGVDNITVVLALAGPRGHRGRSRE